MIKFPIKRLPLLLIAPLLVMCLPAASQPNSSPSAVAAARLKNKPPRNWIRHYLGDDRYKIAGGIWKVVSTELDRYYYPAWAPEMLRQKPGIVIGFASAAEAEEAGYMPSGYPMNQSLYGLTAAEIFAAKQRGALPSAPSGTRITLSDGQSSIILPRGWTHSRLESQAFGNLVAYQADMLTPPGSKQGIYIAFFRMPGQDLEAQLKAQASNQGNSQPQQQPGQKGGLQIAVYGTQFKPATLGGLRGYSFVPTQQADLPPGLKGRLIAAARGDKIYAAGTSLPATDKSYPVVLNSFQPR